MRLVGSSPLAHQLDHGLWWEGEAGEAAARVRDESMRQGRRWSAWAVAKLTRVQGMDAKVFGGADKEAGSTALLKWGSKPGLVAAATWEASSWLKGMCEQAPDAARGHVGRKK